MIRHRYVPVTGLVAALLLSTTSPVYSAASALIQRKTSITTVIQAMYATVNQTYVNSGIPLTLAMTANTPKNFYVNNSGVRAIAKFTINISSPVGGTVTVLQACSTGDPIIGVNICTSGNPMRSFNIIGSSVTVFSGLSSRSFMNFQMTSDSTGTYLVNISYISSDIAATVTNS